MTTSTTLGARGSGPRPDPDLTSALNADPHACEHGLDAHPDSPADWPLIPVAVRVRRQTVYADLFSWSLLIARLATEWQDLGEPVDADVSYSLERARAALRLPIEDGWVIVGTLEAPDGGGLLVSCPWLAGLHPTSAAWQQPSTFPLYRLERGVPFGTGEVPFPRSPTPDHWDEEGQCRDPHCKYPNHPTAQPEEAP